MAFEQRHGSCPTPRLFAISPIFLSWWWENGHPFFLSSWLHYCSTRIYSFNLGMRAGMIMVLYFFLPATGNWRGRSQYPDIKSFRECMNLQRTMWDRLCLLIHCQWSFFLFFSFFQSGIPFLDPATSSLIRVNNNCRLPFMFFVTKLLCCNAGSFPVPRLVLYCWIFIGIKVLFTTYSRTSGE